MSLLFKASQWGKRFLTKIFDWMCHIKHLYNILTTWLFYHNICRTLPILWYIRCFFIGFHSQNSFRIVRTIRQWAIYHTLLSIITLCLSLYWMMTVLSQMQQFVHIIDVWKTLLRNNDVLMHLLSAKELIIG